MKTKFNKFERVAGLFVSSAVLGSLGIALAVMIEKGIFEEKLHLQSELKNADGIHAGTEVLMAGLRAGSVTDVKLLSNEKIIVKFEIGSSYRDRVRSSSIVRLVRPFIIGEKALEVTVGNDTEKQIADNETLGSEESIDLMDLASGRKLGGFLSSMTTVIDNARTIVEKVFDPKRSTNVLTMFDNVQPLVKNMVGVSAEMQIMMHQMNQKKDLQHLITNLTEMSGQMNEMLPAFKKKSPQVAEDLARMTKNMADVSTELQKVLPTITEGAPEFPKAARRAMEALDETVVTLKAMQKSFLLRGNVREVKEEEVAREKRDTRDSQDRQPASQDKGSKK